MSDALGLFERYLMQRKALDPQGLVLEPSIAERLRSLSALNAASPDMVPASDIVPASERRPDSDPRSRSAQGQGDRKAQPGDRRSREGAPPPSRPSAAPTPAVTGSPVPVASLATLDALRDAAMGCVACGLARTRTNVVFGEGDPSARLVVVGEAPGADEDRTGQPFVGRAGKLLDTLLISIGFSRESVYICNVLKCRPPGNRNPEPVEVATCSPFLRRQIEFVRPDAILAVGTFPAQTLLATTDPIGRLRGTVFEYEGVPLVPTYHPAALLRNPGWIRPVWEDLQKLRRVIDEKDGSPEGR